MTDLFGNDLPIPVEPKERKQRPEPRKPWEVRTPPPVESTAPVPPRPKRNFPIKERPGTLLGNRARRRPLFKEYGGERRIIGIISLEKRIYQRGINLDEFIYRAFGEEMTFDWELEWLPIQGRVGRIEHVYLAYDQWDFAVPDEQNWERSRLYTCKASDARRHGVGRQTPRGKRWCVPLGVFEVYDRHGKLLVEGTTPDA